MELHDRFRGCLLGLAAGDAVGTTVEFSARNTFEPVTGMEGGGPFSLEPGQWTDDTSMSLCLAASLLECDGFDPDDQMQRYLRWRDEGYMSSNGRCFDIGNTVSQALERYRHTGEPFSGSTDPYSAGNGCIMRLAPVPMFFHNDREAAIHYSGESSRTTHGAEECIHASRLFGALLHDALSGFSKEELLLGSHGTGTHAEKVGAIATGSYRTKTRDQIQGTGYVIASLEAALWCFWRTDSFRDAVLDAVNLGDDADTTAAVTGQIAGAYYGVQAIPDDWLAKLAMKDAIVEMVDTLYDRGQQF